MTKHLYFQSVDVVDRISVPLGVVSAPHGAAHRSDHVSVMHFARYRFPLDHPLPSISSAIGRPVFISRDFQGVHRLEPRVRPSSSGVGWLG
jgi:hypothetical protein